MTSVRAGLSRFRQKAKVLRQELWCLSKHAGLLRFASNPSREREGFQNAGSARERSAVALSSLVAPLRGGAIYRVDARARDYQIVLSFATDWLP